MHYEKSNVPFCKEGGHSRRERVVKKDSKHVRSNFTGHLYYMYSGLTASRR